jgi:hypothetical protein
MSSTSQNPSQVPEEASDSIDPGPPSRRTCVSYGCTGRRYGRHSTCRPHYEADRVLFLFVSCADAMSEDDCLIFLDDVAQGVQEYRATVEATA